MNPWEKLTIAIGRIYKAVDDVEAIRLPEDYVVLPRSLVAFGLKIPQNMLLVNIKDDAFIDLDSKKIRNLNTGRTILKFNDIKEVVKRDAVGQFEKLEKRSLSDGLIDLSNYTSFKFGDFALEDPVARIYEGTKVGVIANVETKTVDVMMIRWPSFSFGGLGPSGQIIFDEERIKPLGMEIEYDEQLPDATDSFKWRCNFKWNVGIIHYFDSKDLLREISDVVKEEHKDALVELLNYVDFKEFERLYREEMTIISLLGLVYGKDAIGRVSEIPQILRKCAEYLRDLSDYLVCAADEILNALEDWYLLPYKVKDGKIEEVVLVNRDFPVSIIIKEEGVDYQVDDFPLKDMFLKNVFVDDKNLAEKLVELVNLKKEWILKDQKSLKEDFLLVKIIKELEDVRIENGQIVSCKVRYGISVLEELWRELRRKIHVRSEKVQMALNRAIEKEKKALKEFIDELQEIISEADMVIEVPKGSMFGGKVLYYSIKK